MSSAEDTTNAVRVGADARQRVYRPAGGTRGTESFEGRKERVGGDRLGPIDLAELEALWCLRDASMGVRSQHGAVQARLLRAPPRDEARRAVLDELERAGGRMPEGALLRIVAAEKGLATVYEVRRATQMLQAQRKVERVQVGPPTCQRVGIDDVSVTPPRGDGAGIDNMRMALPPERLTEAQRQWTGYEIRLIRPEEQKVENGELAMRLALRMTKLTGEAKRDRWRRQDEALEAECHRIEVHDTDGGQRPIEHEDSSLTARQIAGITRASATLALISATHRAVIRSWYFDAKESLEAVGEYTAMAQEAAEAAKAPTVATMIRRRAQAASQNYDPEWVAGLRKAAEILLDEASGAYREARRAISAR